jgi:methyl-accepting chemotaxis protein
MLNTLSLRTKTYLNGVALFIPIIWLIYLLISQMNLAINFGKQEIIGNNVLPTLHALITHAGERGAQIALNQNTSSSTTEIDKLKVTLTDLQKKYGDVLRTSEQYDALQKALTDASANTSEAQTALMAAARAFYSRVGDTSNLILDPDLDTYYIMDAILIKMPNSIDLLWQINDLGNHVIQKNVATAAEKTQLVVLSGLLKSDIDGLNYDAKVAYENNPAGDLSKKVESTLISYTTATTDLLTVVSNTMTGDTLQLDGAAFNKAINAALSTHEFFYQEASPALTTMLDRRVDKLSFQKWLILGGVFSCLTLVSIFAFFVAQGVLKSLGGEPDDASRIVRTIAMGDLTTPIHLKKGDTNSLLANIFNMQNELQKIISQIRNSAETTLEAANDLSTRSNVVVESSRDQSHATSTMGSAIEEVSVSIKQMSEHAQHSKELSEHSAHIAKSGETIVAEVATDMNQLSSFVQHSSESVQELGKQSEQIYSIVNVIKGIADQTNLLALNAAIEAARAGEQGRGFAVVADEVRSLAARTSASTKEIADMIAKIQQGTNLVVGNMEESVTRTTDNVAKVNQAMQSMTEMRNATASAMESIKEIALTLNQQTDATDLLSQTVEQVSQLATQNSHSIDQVNSVVDRLRGLAQMQRAAVEKFITTTSANTTC